MRFSGVQSEKLLRRKRKKFYVRLTLSFFFLFALVFGLGKLSSWSKLSVPEIVVRGNDVVKTEDVVALAREQMDGEYFLFFSKKNILIYPKESISAAVSERFKRIKNITLGVGEQNKLTIDVVERDPVGLWCADTCYYLDETGYIFEEAPQFSEEVYVTYRGDIKEGPIGQTYLTPAEFGELRALILNIERLGFAVTSAIKKERDEYEIKIKNTVVSGEGQAEGTFFINKKQSFDESFENLSIFVAQYSTKNPAGLKSFDYIDLRFGKNIVYKFN